MWNIVIQPFQPQIGRNKRWQAYLRNRPRIKGIGRSKEEAVGALWNQMVGKFILDKPSIFNVTLNVLDIAA